MSDVNQPRKPLFADENAKLESLIERFEEAWQSETPPKLTEEFLKQAPASGLFQGEPPALVPKTAIPFAFMLQALLGIHSSDLSSFLV
jgi:hypothetical protein